MDLKKNLNRGVHNLVAQWHDFNLFETTWTMFEHMYYEFLFFAFVIFPAIF